MRSRTRLLSSNQAIKATVFWEPNHHCRIFDVGRYYARMIKFRKRYFLETLENNETNSGHKHSTVHTCTLVVFKNTFLMNLNFLVLRFSQNFHINVTKIAHIVLHNIRIFLSKTKKVLTLSQAKHQPNLEMNT